MLNVYLRVRDKTEKHFLIDRLDLVEMGNWVIEVQNGILLLSLVFLDIANECQVSKCVKFILGVKRPSNG